MAAKALKLCALALAAITAPIAMAQQASEVVVYGPAPKPVPVPGAKPITGALVRCIQGRRPVLLPGHQGLEHARGRRRRRWQPLPDRRDQFRLQPDHVERQYRRCPRSAQRERRALGRPNFAIPANDGSVYIVYAGQAPLRMAGDAAGLRRLEMPISLFLRTPDNYPSRKPPGRARPFPKGSVPTWRPRASSMTY